MVGWHYWLNGHGFGWTLAVGDGQESWCAVVHGVAKSRTQLSDWTDLAKGVGRSTLKASDFPTLEFFFFCKLFLLYLSMSIFPVSFHVWKCESESVSCSIVSHSLGPHGLCSLPHSSVRGFLQARVLEWVAIPFSKGSSWPRDRIQVFPHYRWILYLLSQ